MLMLTTSEYKKKVPCKSNLDLFVYVALFFFISKQFVFNVNILCIHVHTNKINLTGVCLPFSRGQISAPFPIEKSHLFCFYQLRKVKKKSFYFFLETTTSFEKLSPISE